jgi:hypothetical protein
VLQRGASVKKKGEAAKEYKERFCYLAPDCRALLLAKSHRSKERAKTLAAFVPGGAAVHVQRGPPQHKHKRDAETPGFAAATFSLRVPGPGATAAAATAAAAVVVAGAGGVGTGGGAHNSGSFSSLSGAAVASGTAVVDLWLPSEAECEEWLRALPLVLEAWAHPLQGPRELVWDGPAGAWVEGPRHYIETLAEDLARSSLVAYLEAQQRRLRRRTMRRSLNRHSAALTQSRLAGATMTTAAVLGSGAGGQRQQAQQAQQGGGNGLNRVNAVLAKQAAAMRARVRANAAARRARGAGGGAGGVGGGRLQKPQSLAEMARFHPTPIARAFHHSEMTETGQGQALKAFKLVMQYMGDLPPEELTEGTAGAGGSGAGEGGGSGGGNGAAHGGMDHAPHVHPHPHTHARLPRAPSHRLFSGLTGGGSGGGGGGAAAAQPPPPPPLSRPPSGENGEEDGGWSPQQAALLQQLLQLGQSVEELRNELYVAAVAQTTESPHPASLLRGWQLLAAFARTFPPRDEELRDVVILHADRAACCRHVGEGGAGVSALAHHVYEALLHSAAVAAAAAAAAAAAVAAAEASAGGGLDGWPTQPAVALPPSTQEGGGGGASVLLSLRDVLALQRLVVPASVFGCSLEEVLRKELVLARACSAGGGASHHATVGSGGGASGTTIGTIGLPPAGALVEQGNVPLVLQALVRRFQELNGYEVEGIFRRAAHTDAVLAARRRLEDGAYVVYGPGAVGTDDPLVVADLIKIWLRLLSEPLIPSRSYHAALDAGRAGLGGDTRPTLRLLRDGLPPANAATLQYLVQFLNHCAELSPVNQMTPTNLSIVMSPNLLRHPSDDPLRMVQNAEGERRFVAVLMEAVRKGEGELSSPRSGGRRSPSSAPGAVGGGKGSPTGGGGKQHGYGRKLTRLIFGAR